MGKAILLAVLFTCSAAALVAALGIIGLRAYAYLLHYFLDLMGA